MKYLNTYKLFESKIDIDKIEEYFRDLDDLGFKIDTRRSNLYSNILFDKRTTIYNSPISLNGSFDKDNFNITIGIFSKQIDDINQIPDHLGLSVFEKSILVAIQDSVHKMLNIYLTEYKTGNYYIFTNGPYNIVVDIEFHK